MEKSIRSYNLVPPNLSYNNVEDQARELRAEKSILVTPYDLSGIDMLNEKQKQAFKVINERIYLEKRRFLHRWSGRNREHISL